MAEPLPTEKMKEKKAPTFGEKQVGTLAVALDKSAINDTLKSIDTNIIKMSTDFKKFFEDLSEANSRLLNQLSLGEPQEVKVIEQPKDDKEDTKADPGGFSLLSGLLAGFSAWSLELDKLLIAGRYVVVGFKRIIDGFKSIIRVVTESKIFTSVVEFFSSIGRAIKSFFAPTIEAVGKVGRFLKTLFSPIIKVFQFIGEVIGPVIGGVRSAFSWVRPLLSFFRFLGGPITLAITALLDGVFGFIEGFKSGGILGGIEGAFKGILTGLVTKPLDLIKDVVSWISNKLGFSEFSATLDSFSFTEQFEKLWGKIKEIFTGIGNWFGTLFTDPVAALKTAWDTYVSAYWDFGNWMYNSVIKPVVNWIGEKLGANDVMGEFEKTVQSSIDWIVNFPNKVKEKVIDPVVNWITDLFNKIEIPSIPDIGGSLNNFTKDMLASILPPKDAMAFNLPSVDLGVLGKWGGGTVNLNPIPDSAYSYAGLGAKTGTEGMSASDGTSAASGTQIGTEGMSASGGTSAASGTQIGSLSTDVAEGQRFGGGSSVSVTTGPSIDQSNKSKQEVRQYNYYTMGRPKVAGSPAGQ